MSLSKGNLESEEILMPFATKEELKIKTCQRVEGNYLTYDLKHSRLTESQVIDILKDFYLEDSHCLFGDPSEHFRQMRTRHEVIKSLTTPKILSNKYGKKLTEEMLHILVDGILSEKESLFLFWAMTNKDDRNPQSKSLYTLLDHPNLASNDFKSLFYRMIYVVDGLINNADNQDRIVSYVTLEIFSKAVSSEHLSEEERLLLCYSKMEWLREAVSLVPNCPQEGKVAISLLNSGVSSP